ncbi:hypothetical protein C8Q77DRAFT_255567 [Trametes polyzona]|nr:hypothetical protein C8Q77DRAFT_255567 [Trametes polyzona]
MGYWCCYQVWLPFLVGSEGATVATAATVNWRPLASRRTGWAERWNQHIPSAASGINHSPLAVEHRTASEAGMRVGTAVRPAGVAWEPCGEGMRSGRRVQARARLAGGGRGAPWRAIASVARLPLLRLSAAQRSYAPRLISLKPHPSVPSAISSLPSSSFFSRSPAPRPATS